jgi:hypothetical protein
MTIVDLAKARAFAESLDRSGHVDPEGRTADWINDLADEIESMERALVLARRSEQAALADAARLAEENDLLRTALLELLREVGELVKGIAG